MGRTVKLNLQGQEVEAEEVEFETVREEWNEYRLKDGTLVRVRAVVSDIFLTGRQIPTGEPEVAVRASNVIQTRLPAATRKPRATH